MVRIVWGVSPFLANLLSEFLWNVLGAGGDLTDTMVEALLTVNVYAKIFKVGHSGDGLAIDMHHRILFIPFRRIYTSSFQEHRIRQALHLHHCVFGKSLISSFDYKLYYLKPHWSLISCVSKIKRSEEIWERKMLLLLWVQYHGSQFYLYFYMPVT